MFRTPKYRSDVAGCLKAVMLDCTEAMQYEIRKSNEFIILVQDLSAYQDYYNQLTDNELRTCFNNAKKGY